MPPGCGVAEVEGLATGPGGAAALELARAEAQFGLAEALGERRDPGDILARDAALARLTRHLRRAEQALTLAGDAPAEKGPNGQPLADWLAALRERQRGLPVGAGEADAAEETEEMPVQGTPYRGRLGETRTPPRLTLRVSGW